MRTPFLILLAACLYAMPLGSMQTAAAQTLFSLTIDVQNVRNSAGEICVVMFASEEGWPHQRSLAVKARAFPAQQGSMTVTIPNVPPGVYALAVLHDENGNRKLDRNVVRMPKEQWGMSNNPGAIINAPSFDEASFEVQGDLRLEVKMK